MMDPIQIASLIIGLLGVVAGLLGLRRKPAPPPKPPVAPPPKHHAEDHHEAAHTDTAAAVAAAADAHDVPAADVAADLDWLDADDVR